MHEEVRVSWGLRRLIHLVDLADAVETVIYLLKDETTGLGTTGYEVTDNWEDPVSILVSYKLAKEELKDLFGGDQNFGLIVTVEKTNVKDEWIGLTTKMLTTEVTITLYAIDKWSETGEDAQFIVASILRSVAMNALRKFIKANTDLTGYGLSNWKSTNWKEEEDRTVQPWLYKCIVTTEVTTFYAD
jgi:hypothetical protein